MDATALQQGMGALLPHGIILITGLAILILDLFLTPRSRYLNEVVGLVGIGLALVFTLRHSGGPQPIFMQMAVVDTLGTFFNAIFLLIAVLTVLLSANYVRREELSAGEYYALLCFATAGFMFVASSADLVMVFLALETLSVATYILAGLLRSEPRSQEAAFKYFMLGAFSSAIFLYGIATVYGALGNTNLVALATALQQHGTSPLLLVGMALLTVGLGFKVAVVPFHMWAPDVYDGAPTSVTAFMTAGPKAAAFAAFLRVFFQGFAPAAAAQEWVPVFVWLAALTMILGNLVALPQQSIKRMLAYSSIAHAGYAFVALVAPNVLGASSILYYLVAYTMMSLGAFTVLTVVAKQGDQRHAFGDYAGLGTTHPLLAAVMSLFMFALAGFPPTAGFAGKFYIFNAAVRAGYPGLALIGMLTSVVSVVYYARVVIAMYMQEPLGEPQMGRVPAAIVAVLGLTAFGTLYLGVFPGSVLRLAEQSVQLLF
ncbi:NAD(P)H-quinone oxidoreductase subunit 2 [Candidatus Entotheonellaceae bacterium PAL068K]